MNDSPLWLSASLACLLTLVLLACAACLFLIRRVNRLSRSEQRTEQRLIQLAVDFRGLEQRVREMKGQQREASAAARSESPPSLISIPDMTTRPPDESDDAANLAQKHAEVWAMAERGLAAAEIARSTRRPIGEVELILGLRGRRNASKSAGDHVNAT